MKTGPRYAPQNETRESQKKRPGRADGLSRLMRELPEGFLHGNRLSRKHAAGPQHGLVFYRLEAVTAAHRGDFQMKARMAGMAAVIDEIFLSFLRGSNLRENSVGRVIFSKMGAQTTLTFMHM